MVSVDDSRLTELSAEPPQRLFPVLDRAAAMAPLVVLMAVLPGLTALVVVPPESTVVTKASNGPGIPNPEITSPWGSWLAEEPWRGWPGFDELTATWLPLVPAYLASVVLVWLAWHAGRGLFGARTGLLAALMVCCHTPLLMLGRSSEPLALSAVVATATVTGFVAHLQRTQRLVSLSLVVAIFGLATTLLLATPLVWPVVVLLFVAVVCHSVGELGFWGNGAKLKRSRADSRWHGPLSGLAVIGVAALLLGAYAAWSGPKQLDSVLLASAGRGLSGWHSMIERIHWLGWLGWLSGPVLLGIVDVVRGVLGADREKRLVAVLAMMWAVLVPLTIGLADAGYPLRLAEAFVLVPLAVLAGRGIESICERRVAVGSVVAATWISGCLGGDRVLNTMLGPVIADTGMRAGAVVVIAVAVGGGVALVCRRAELYQRRVLVSCLVLLVVAQVITGWLDVPVAAIESLIWTENWQNPA